VNFLPATNVVSELTKQRPNLNVVRWFRSVPPTDLFLSVITLAEIRKGIELKRVTNAQDAARFETWLQTLILHYRSRILALDEEAADRWGKIMAAHPRVPVEDGQIAAIALRHAMTLVTRNLRHVAPMGVVCLDPF
jgi:predicted nucleic acid-binding protein